MEIGDFYEDREPGGYFSNLQGKSVGTPFVEFLKVRDFRIENDPAMVAKGKVGFTYQSATNSFVFKDWAIPLLLHGLDLSGLNLKDIQPEVNRMNLVAMSADASLATLLESKYELKEFGSQRLTEFVNLLFRLDAYTLKHKENSQLPAIVKHFAFYLHIIFSNHLGFKLITSDQDLGTNNPEAHGVFYSDVVQETFNNSLVLDFLHYQLYEGHTHLMPGFTPLLSKKMLNEAIIQGYYDETFQIVTDVKGLQVLVNKIILEGVNQSTDLEDEQGSLQSTLEKLYYLDVQYYGEFALEYLINILQLQSNSQINKGNVEDLYNKRDEQLVKSMEYAVGLTIIPEEEGERRMEEKSFEWDQVVKSKYRDFILYVIHQKILAEAEYNATFDINKTSKERLYLTKVRNLFGPGGLLFLSGFLRDFPLLKEQVFNSQLFETILYEQFTRFPYDEFEETNVQKKLTPQWLPLDEPLAGFDLPEIMSLFVRSDEELQSLSELPRLSAIGIAMSHFGEVWIQVCKEIEMVLREQALTRENGLMTKVLLYIAKDNSHQIEHNLKTIFNAEVEKESWQKFLRSLALRVLFGNDSWMYILMFSEIRARISDYENQEHEP